MDPSLIIRRVYTIPAFSLGHEGFIPEEQPSRNPRLKLKSNSEYEAYCVNRFVLHFYLNGCERSHNLLLRFANRDIFMYHRGGGVGHSIRRSDAFEAAEAGDYKQVLRY